MTEHEERSCNWKEGLARKRIISPSYSASLHRSPGLYVDVIIKLRKGSKTKTKTWFYFVTMVWWCFSGNERLLGAHSRETVIRYLYDEKKICSAVTWYAPFLPFSFFLTGIFTQWLEIKLTFCSYKDKSHMERLTESIWFLNGWSCTSPALPASRLSDKGEKNRPLI